MYLFVPVFLYGSFELHFDEVYGHPVIFKLCKTRELFRGLVGRGSARTTEASYTITDLAQYSIQRSRVLLSVSCRRL